MIWNLTCRKARRSLALRAGNDLDEAGRIVTERHLASCPQCRSEWQRLQAGQQALELARTASGAARSSEGPAAGMLPLRVRDGSIWPEVIRQIRAIEQPAEAVGLSIGGPLVGWRSWLPLGTMAAACLVVILALAPDFEVPGSTSPYGPAASQTVGGINVPVNPPDRDELGKWSLPPDSLDGPRVRMLIDGTPIGEFTGAVRGRTDPRAGR